MLCSVYTYKKVAYIDLSSLDVLSAKKKQVVSSFYCMELRYSHLTPDSLLSLDKERERELEI